MLAMSASGWVMDEEMRIHLFEPFFRLKEYGRAPGLELAMVYGIVKQNGGQIAVESQLGVAQRFGSICRWSNGRCRRPTPPLLLNSLRLRNPHSKNHRVCASLLTRTGVWEVGVGRRRDFKMDGTGLALHGELAVGRIDDLVHGEGGSVPDQDLVHADVAGRPGPAEKDLFMGSRIQFVVKFCPPGDKDQRRPCKVRPVPAPHGRGLL